MVVQTSQRAAINWQSFNIGSQQELRINQPSAAAITLMRVVGPNPSQIAGRIDSNGMIVLTNGAGVVIYKGAQANDAGVVISAPGITNENLMAGKMTFDRAAKPGATVEVAGDITVADGGPLTLLAPGVQSSGILDAQRGSVYLLGADTATLNMTGHSPVTLGVPNQVTAAPANPSGALVSLTGQIQAQGGFVEVEGSAADGLVENLVKISGSVSTPTAGAATGEITVGGIGGGALVTGTLAARGGAPGEAGGKVGIEASGTVALKGSAIVNTAGEAGGGVIAVGTTLARAEGGPSVMGESISSEVTVGSGVKLNADALGNGAGGRVTLLATGVDDFGGTITATGGPHGGNGGFVEVSGNTVGLTGMVDVSAPMGTTGTLLLDPVKLTCRLRGWNSPTPPPAGCVLAG
ncbi:MAG TPA: filamentous hemagglutinin N-terminal domain-containing protein [Candidatus Dormibacteraeota bacterium]|nr:filamentous hemagglutinin N-terminal domain-containing protein [Candidatus Dormibacteraeota bacterium]